MLITNLNRKTGCFVTKFHYSFIRFYAAVLVLKQRKTM